MDIGKFPLLTALLLAAACSGGGDEDNAETSADGGNASACQQAPSRFIVLGDSISACFGVDGKDSATCGPNIFHGTMDATYAPGLSYENLAVSGSVTTDVVDRQLATVPGGAGHAMVLIYIGGNDLQRYLVQPDAAAVSGFNADLPSLLEDWDTIFAFFNDTAKFPDGVTIMMNNQYNPFDDCTAPPYNISQTKSGLLAQYNDELAQLAASHENAFLTDQHSPYLGHGHHYNVDSCPHFEAGLEPFMEDLIHPNIAGHAHLAEQWSTTAAAVYEGCE